jgi:two-component system, chemotaxis family, chemotaxis protein CheY
MKTLIVDDVPANCRVLKALISPFGSCETAATGREAIDAFQAAWKVNNPYQLICLDIMLPDYSGIKVLEVIRKMEEAMKVGEDQRVRAIMITATADFDLQAKARELLCDGYLQKPIFRKDLIEALKRTKLIPSETVQESKPEHGAD